MPTFIAIGYGDREGYDRTAQSARDAAHAHDAALQAGGALMGIAGPPVQVRNHGARQVETRPGPYLASELPVAGFSVIEAATLEQAIQIASHTPCAVAYGVVEVWPLKGT
ncbi:transcription initiation protein [Luteimonas sp. SJ-92]|uniref:Transcription initiation protein n=1 Tax=Luteimonas salinisoli TaxID=2752307 RepID=A0A853JBV4_9GAMM|nr:YciI family protein [Luteimonas salinisoli]NZA26234.1 transcription initiation protein [Luteimonas salinisoli]